MKYMDSSVFAYLCARACVCVLAMRHELQLSELPLIWTSFNGAACFAYVRSDILFCSFRTMKMKTYLYCTRSKYLKSFSFLGVGGLLKWTVVDHIDVVDWTIPCTRRQYTSRFYELFAGPQRNCPTFKLVWQTSCIRKPATKTETWRISNWNLESI